MNTSVSRGNDLVYESVEQMQTDLDSYLEHYNTQRPHQGRMMEDRRLTACSRRSEIDTGSAHSYTGP